MSDDFFILRMEMGGSQFPASLKLLMIVFRLESFVKVKKMHVTGLKKNVGFFQENGICVWNAISRLCLIFPNCKQKNELTARCSSKLAIAFTLSIRA